MLKEQLDAKKELVTSHVAHVADDTEPTMTVLEANDAEQFRVTVIDPAMPAPDLSLSGNGRSRLFFVPAIVQNKFVHMLADSGSVRNLINDKLFADLQFQPPLRSPGDCRVVGCNNQALPLKGFAILPVVIQSVVLWHEFGVVSNFPLDALIGADIMAPHFAMLRYIKDDQRSLEFGIKDCTICTTNRQDEQSGVNV